MEIGDLLNNKLAEIVNQQIRYYWPEISEKEIQDILDRIEQDEIWTNIESARYYVLGSSILRKMDELCFYLDCAYSFHNSSYNFFSADALKAKLKNEPKNLILAFFWIHKYLHELSSEDLRIELPFFLNDIIKEYPQLLMLDNFIENSFGLVLNNQIIKESPLLYLPVFFNAINKFPYKFCFLYYIGMCNVHSNQLKSAKMIFNYFQEWISINIQNNKDVYIDNFSFDNYTTFVLTLLRKYNDSKAYSKVLEITKKVLDRNFSTFKSDGNNFKNYTIFFIDLFFIRMRALHAKRRKKEMVLEFEKIQPFLKKNNRHHLFSKYSDVFHVLELDKKEGLPF
jgi:hypothetical protein